MFGIYVEKSGRWEKVFVAHSIFSGNIIAYKYAKDYNWPVAILVDETTGEVLTEYRRK